MALPRRDEVFWFGRTGASWIDAADNFDNAKKLMEKAFAADAGGYAVLVERENGYCITVGPRTQADVSKGRIPYFGSSGCRRVRNMRIA
jgi:hypothetical protein